MRFITTLFACVFAMFAPWSVAAQEPNPDRNPEEIEAVAFASAAAEEVLAFNKMAIDHLNEALSETRKKLLNAKEKFEKSEVSTEANSAGLSAFTECFEGMRLTSKKLLTEAEELEDGFKTVIIPDLEAEATGIKKALEGLKEEDLNALKFKLQAILVDAAMNAAKKIRGTLVTAKESFEETHKLAEKFSKLKDTWAKGTEGKKAKEARAMLLKVFEEATRVFEQFTKEAKGK